MSTRDFCDQSMGVQERQTAADLGRLSASLQVRPGGAVEERAQVAVAKTFEGPFPSVDYLQQLGIRFLEGIERSRAAAVSTDGSADRDGFFGQWGRIVGRRQSGQVALIGRARDFRPAKEVGDASTQRIPGFPRVRAGFRRAIDPQVFGMVDGRLWPQNVEAVVKLDRVMVDPVLETNSFGTAPQIRNDFS